MASSLSRIENKGKFPSQTETNPKANVNAITLRNWTVPDPKPIGRAKEKEVKIERTNSGEKNVEEKVASDEVKKPDVIIRPRFPQRYEHTKKELEDREIMETFRQVVVNIPLLDAIKKVPRYAKFLKEFCMNKKKLKGKEQVSMGENASPILQGEKMRPKCKDPGLFTIPCKLGNLSIEKAMIDLGASINVMPYSIYQSMNLGPLKRTGVVIQLADRSNVYPKGVLEDVLVQVNELVFPADFYVIDMEEHNTSKSSMILLGRPFLKTSRTKIDVHDGTLTMDIDGEIIKFNIYDAMRYPSDVSSVNFVDVLDPISHDLFDLTNRDLLEIAITRHLDLKAVNSLVMKYDLRPELKETVLEMDSIQPKKFEVSCQNLPSSHAKLFPSIVQAHELELKELPKHLKYAFVGKKNTLPMITSSELSDDQEERVVDTLEKHKTCWAIKKCNFGMDEDGSQRRLQLQELEEIRHGAYESSRVYKERTKAFHDKLISRKTFEVGQKIFG